MATRRRTKAQPRPRTKPKADSKQLDVRAGSRVLAKGLKTLPDSYFECRDVRHKWDVTHDYHAVPYAHAGRKLQALRRVLTCDRCTASRTQHFINGRYGITKIADHTTRPKDYSISGVPRGVKQSTIVQQESYRRALERATGAKPGQRATAER